MDKQIFVVEASAGSGKTYALARRYLKLLLRSSARQAGEEEALRSILAITFMNKAAVEMKERILELLKRLALDAFKNESCKRELLDYIGLEEKSCRQAAFRAMREIIRRYDYFQVQTIDSFINSLLLGCAFRLGLSANFTIREDYNKYIALSLDRLLDAAAQEKEVQKLFLDFIRHYLSIENRGGWLVKQDILAVARALFSEFNRYGVPFAVYPQDDEDRAAQKREIYRRIVKISKEIDRPGIDKRFVKAVNGLTGQNAADFQLDRLTSAYWQRKEIPCNKGARVPGELDEEWRELRAEIRGLCETEAYSFFNPYIRIFNRVFGFFLLQSQKEDILFLEELNARARLLFGKGAISLPEIYYRIGSRFRHFLIDEFQDTSVLQWHNIFILAEEALSTGGTLFYVGDKKQAVYRFRGGEAQLFDGVKKELGQFGCQEDVLGRNYRSSQEIVRFNNRIFSEENLRQFIGSYNAEQEAKSKDDARFRFFPVFEQELLRAFARSAQEPQPDKPAGYVGVERLDILSGQRAAGDDPDDEESPDIVREKLLAVIKDLRFRGFDFKDIAILARSGARVEETAGWLVEEGIPVESEKTLNIRENGLIKEIISFLQFLDSPIDDLGFASFILGEIFRAASGLDREEMAEFIFRNRMQRKKEETAACLYRAFQREFPQAWEQHIKKFFKNAGFLPLYETLVTIYADFGVLEKFPGHQSFLMSLLELVMEKEEEYNGARAFLEYFKEAVNDKLYVKFPAGSAVRVMTVHKAKGLEFPAVIIPFLRINPRAESSADNRGASYIPDLDRGENVLRLLRLKKEHRRFSPAIQARHNEEYFRSFLDELNNIYVSFTRAMRELYIFIPTRPGAARQAVEFLIPDDVTAIGEKGGPPGKEDEHEKVSVLSPGRGSDWIAMLKDESSDCRRLKSRRQIARGEALHYIFSLLGNLSGRDADAELNRAVVLARARFPGYADFAALQVKIKELLNDPRFKGFFFCADGQVWTEKEVVNRFGDTRRIDRLIFKDAEAVVVDFKTGTEEEGQEKQVQEYIGLISAIYPGKSVRGCLLYVDELMIKEVY